MPNPAHDISKISKRFKNSEFLAAKHNFLVNGISVTNTDIITL